MPTLRRPCTPRLTEAARWSAATISGGKPAPRPSASCCKGANPVTGTPRRGGRLDSLARTSDKKRNQEKCEAVFRPIARPLNQAVAQLLDHPGRGGALGAGGH